MTSVVCTYETFRNNFGISQYLEKYFKESCLVYEKYFLFKYSKKKIMLVWVTDFRPPTFHKSSVDPDF